MDVQVTNTAVEEIIRRLPKFGGSHYEDVSKWLHDTEEIYEQAQLRPSNKYIVAQYYLTATAEKWFRFNRSTIHDWFTFKIEIVKAFPSSFNPILLKSKQSQELSHVSTSSTISLTPTVLETKRIVENDPLDLLNDNRIESFEALENEDSHECEQECSSSTLVNINDIDLESQPRSIDAPDDFFVLKPQCEFVIPPVYVETDVADAFEASEIISSIPTDDLVIDCVISEAVPPPKLIQEYKFNILYPELIDKARLPSFSPDIHEDDSDFPIHKFQTRLSCKNFAFTIIIKEWDYLTNHGFRCHSQNVAWQLSDSFRKWKYRHWKYLKWKQRQSTFVLFLFLLFSLMHVFYLMFSFSIFLLFIQLFVVFSS